MGTIITAATIMALYLNSAGNVGSQYCYNADVENGKVTTMYVFDKQGESLVGKLEYRYSYDEAGRIASKVVLRRNAFTGRMTPCSRYDYAYSPSGYSLTHSRWDSAYNRFAPADSRTDYQTAGEGLMSVATYELHDNGSEARLVDDVLALMPAEGGMVAGF